MFEPINRISRVFPHFPSSPKIRYLEYLWNAVRARNLPRFPFRVSCSLWKYCFKFLREESIRCWKTCTTAFKRTLCHPSRFHRNGNTYHFHDFFGSTGLSFRFVLDRWFDDKSEQRTEQLLCDKLSETGETGEVYLKLCGCSQFTRTVLQSMQNDSSVQKLLSLIAT